MLDEFKGETVDKDSSMEIKQDENTKDKSETDDRPEKLESSQKRIQKKQIRASEQKFQLK